MWLPHSPFVYSRINKNGNKPKIKVMTKLEIFKLQADAAMQPHVMWRIEVEKNVMKYPMDLIKAKSMWEWDEDIEHDAMVASLFNFDRINSTTREIVDCMLMNVSVEGTDEYENISDVDYQDLIQHVFNKLGKVIKNEIFHKDVFNYYEELFEQWDGKIENLIK